MKSNNEQIADQCHTADYLENEEIIEKVMIRFLRPPAGMSYVFIILLLIILYHLYPLFWNYASPPGNYIILFLIPAEIVYCIYIQFKKYRKYRSYIESVSESGELRQMAKDFSRAEGFFKGSFRLGNRYIFVSGSGKIFDYNKIEKIYEEWQPETRSGLSFIPEIWCLKAVLTDGKESTLFIMNMKRTEEKVSTLLSPSLKKIMKRAPHITIKRV